MLLGWDGLREAPTPEGLAPTPERSARTHGPRRHPTRRWPRPISNRRAGCIGGAPRSGWRNSPCPTASSARLGSRPGIGATPGAGRFTGNRRTTPTAATSIRHSPPPRSPSASDASNGRLRSPRQQRRNLPPLKRRKRNHCRPPRSCRLPRQLPANASGARRRRRRRGRPGCCCRWRAAPIASNKRRPAPAQRRVRRRAGRRGTPNPTGESAAHEQIHGRVVSANQEPSERS